MRTFWTWSHFAATEGVSSLYGSGGWPPDQRTLHFLDDSVVVDYPPVALYYLQAVGTTVPQWLPIGRGLSMTIAIKGVVLLASSAIACLIWYAARRMGGDRAAWLAALGYWANPVAMYHAALGYIGALAFAPGIGALIAASLMQPWLSGALMAMGVLTKPQAVFVVPAVIALLLSKQGRPALVSAGAGAAAVTGVVLLPFALAGTLTSVLHVVPALAAGPMLSSATNFWWIIGGLADPGPITSALNTRQLLQLPYSVAGWPAGSLVIGALAWGTVAVVVTWAALVAARCASFASAVACAALTVHVYFVFALQVHENHLALAVPLLAILAAVSRRYRSVLWTVSVMFGLNLMVFYDVFGAGTYVLPGFIGGFETSIIIAIGNLAAFANHARVFLITFVETARPGEPPLNVASPAVALR